MNGYKVGDKVVLTDVSCMFNDNKVGDIGTLTEYNETEKMFRVTVEGRWDFGNWASTLRFNHVQ